MFLVDRERDEHPILPWGLCTGVILPPDLRGAQAHGVGRPWCQSSGTHDGGRQGRIDRARQDEVFGYSALPHVLNGCLRCCASS